MTDVLVVGGGLAGLMAVIEASAAGASALLLEKREIMGGSAVVTPGLIAFAGTDEQREAGVEDGVDKLREDLLSAGKGYCNTDLVDAYCSEQLTLYRWLKDGGLEFGPPHGGSNQSVPRSHAVDTEKLVNFLVGEAERVHATIEQSTRVERLLVKGDRVVGALVKDTSGQREIEASATILTSGGFSQNEALVERLVPKMARARPAGGEGCTGDGLLMAWKIGAATSQIAFIKGTFGMYPWGPAPVNGLLAVYKGAVAVNREGRRFINESLSYKDLGEACLAESDAIAYQIFDSKVLALSDPSVPIYDFGPRLASGQIVSSDSLSGLSKSLDLPSEMFVETIDAYNRAVKGLESDAFNRTKLSGGIGTPTSIDSPPYYAFPSTTFLPGTYGGVEVDLTGSVLDVYGSRIPGLYAAGEVTGGFHGNGYVTGSALGKAAIFGQLAGRAAAEFALAARVK